MKKNIIIMILVILLVGCVSYISYDFINNKLNNQTIKDINEFPEKSDEKTLDLGYLRALLTESQLLENFKTEKNINNEPIIMKCNKYGEYKTPIEYSEEQLKETRCHEIEVIIRDYSFNISSFYNSERVLIFNDYLIKITSDILVPRANMEIINLNTGKKIKDFTYNIALNINMDDTNIHTNPQIIDGNLYFVSVIDNANNNNTNFNMINLNKNDIKIETINTYTTDYPTFD